MKPSLAIVLICLSLLIGIFIGRHGINVELNARRQQTLDNLRATLVGAKLYSIAYSNNPAAVEDLLAGFMTNQPAEKP